MADKFIVEGGKSLEGEIEVRGAKNSAGPILTATLLTNKECVIGNIPWVEDVKNFIEILKSLGVKIEKEGERTLKIKADSQLDPSKIDFERISKIRLSVLLIGALLHRFKHFKISRPGGDRIGVRPITTHLEAFKKLGVIIKEDGFFYEIKVNDLSGKEIILKEFSVTATENLMLAAVLARGKTIIKGAAAEPQIQDLGEMLIKMGAKIKGLGTHQLEIEGVRNLNGTFHELIPDPNEAGTLILTGAVTPGKVKIKNIKFEHLDLFLDKLEELGMNLRRENNALIVDYSPNLKAVNIQALPFPGYPTDLLPPIVPVLTQAQGKSKIHDPLYENRLNFIQELRKMGADIEIVDPHRAFVFGKTPLFGQKIESWDIRAGASLVIAGLIAKGQTIIENVYQIDRGYEKLEERLKNLGAYIKRITS